MKRILVVSLWFFVGLCGWAQDVPKVEIPVGFSMINVHPNLTPVTSFNVFGGGGQVDFNFGNIWGIKADFMGYTQGSGLRDQLRNLGYSGQVNGNLFTYMFGPQIKKHSGTVQPFAEFLFGAAHTNAYSTILTAQGQILQGSGNNNGFAMALGGGIDLKVAKHLALRPLEVDYLLTRFSANHVANYTANQNNFRYVGGLNFLFGGAPTVPVSASCSVSPTEVYPGDPVTATINAQNFNPKHTVTYSWSGGGGKLSGTGTTATMDTAGLAPGSYTAIGTAKDPKESKNNVATCSANFTVNARPINPPQVSCSASPSTVKSGDPSTITASASSPDNAQITGYSYQASAGRIGGNGANATLDTAGAPSGAISVTVTATDARNLAGTGTCSVGVEVPPPPPTCSKINSVQFPDAKRPWRVDNTAKAILDDVASRLKSDPNAKIVIIGYADGEKAPMVGTGKNRHAMNLAAQRAVNAKAYPTQQQGIDPSQSTSFLNAYDPNLAQPLFYEWNTAVEIAPGANESFSATYVGSHGQRLLQQDSIQLSPSGFPLVFATDSAGWSNYNALQVQFQHRMANRWQALISYTLAKASDTASGTQCPCATSNNVNNINIGADYGPSDFDVRNSLAGAFSYQPPAPNWGRIGRAVLEGWQLDGIVRASSAPPYDPLVLTYSPTFGPYYTLPNVVPGVPFYVADPGQPDGKRLNSAAFSTPANGQQGNLPRNYFRAFLISQTDLALSRRVNLTERVNLYLRMEYFNVFNHRMFTPYNNIYVGSPDFGRITQTLNESLSGVNPLYQVGGPRSGQLTVKVQF